MSNTIPYIDTLNRLRHRPLPAGWEIAEATDQASADREIPLLLRREAKVRLVRFVPLAGAVDVSRWTVKPAEWMATCREEGSRYAVASIAAKQMAGSANPLVCDDMQNKWLDSYQSAKKDLIHGVIVGGTDKPMHPDWVRSIRDQCVAAGCCFFFESWGEWLPISEIPDSDYLYRSNRKAKPGEDQGTMDEVYGRICTVDDGVIRFDGKYRDINSPNGWIDCWEPVKGHPAYQTFRVGKKASGRLLDGVEWNGLPAPAVNHLS